MNATMVPFLAMLAGSPANAEMTNAAQVPKPTIIDVDADEVVQLDGRRARWTSVTYELSTGQEAETFLEVDEAGRGEAVIYVEGEPLLRAMTDGATWVAPDIDLPPETITELVSADVATAVFAGITYEPLAFPCSEFGKKVLKVARFLWIGASYAAGAACCIGATAATAAGCVVCAGAVGVVGTAGAEELYEYCD